jgi:hypothetical protein
MASGASLQNMIRAVKKKREQLEDLAPKVASQMADVLVAELEARTPGQEKSPLNTGTMKRALTKRTAPYKAGDFWMVGVGDLSLLHRSAAPRGTIEAFLRDHRQAYEDELTEKGIAAYQAREAARLAAIEARKAARLNRIQQRANRRFEDLKRRLRKLDAQLDAVWFDWVGINTRLVALRERVEARGTLFDPANKKGDRLLAQREARLLARQRLLRARKKALEDRRRNLVAAFAAWRRGAFK